jgi:hypothetical protein
VTCVIISSTSTTLDPNLKKTMSEPLYDPSERPEEVTREEFEDAMKPLDDGGPAFPFVMPDPSTYHTEQGMSLRDYFAAAALQVLLAHMIGVESANGSASKYAERAYEYADAMLAARKEPR